MNNEIFIFLSCVVQSKMSSPEKYVTLCGIGNDKDIQLPVKVDDSNSSIHILHTEAVKEFYPSALTIYQENEGIMKGLRTHDGVIEIADLSIKYKIRLAGKYFFYVPSC